MLNGQGGCCVVLRGLDDVGQQWFVDVGMDFVGMGREFQVDGEYGDQ